MVLIIITSAVWLIKSVTEAFYRHKANYKTSYEE